MATDPKAIAVAMAIKQSIEMNAGAGTAINAHPNAFFLNVSGAVDLYKAAVAALDRAANYEANLVTLFETAVKTFKARLQKELTEGAVSVEDALARLKAKAGGELTVAPGVIEEAVKQHLDFQAGAAAAKAALAAADAHIL